MREYQLVLDVWEGQLEVEEAVLLAADVAGIIIRLNDIRGGHHMDETFATQWIQARNFCRAPYFVYNPWVSGVENYIWLANHMPFDAIAVAVDIEVKMTGYSPAAYAAEVRRFLEMTRVHWRTIIYTGEWFINMLSYWPGGEYWWAQYPYEFFPDNNLFLTWDELRAMLEKFDLPFNVNKVPGILRMWQLSGDRIILPGSTRELDINVFYGSRDDLNDLLGAPNSSPPIEEPMTYTFNTYRLTVTATALQGRSSPAVVTSPSNNIFPNGFLKGDVLTAKEPVLDANGKSKWYPIILGTRNGQPILLPTPPLFAGDGATAVYLKIDAFIPGTSGEEQTYTAHLTDEKTGKSYSGTMTEVK